MSFVNLEIKNVEKTWRDKQLQISSHVIRSQRRSHLEGQGDHAPPPPQPTPTPLHVPNQTRSNSFSFTHQGYCFIRGLEIIRTRNVTIFNVYARIFGQFTATFHFF